MPISQGKDGILRQDTMNRLDSKKRAYEHIKRLILCFKFLPGVRISDKDIAKELGFSRTPVREALQLLCAEGLVEAIQNRGFSVRLFSKSEIVNLYHLREVLENLAIEQSIPNVSEEQIHHLKALNKDVIRKQDAGLLRIIEADEELHRAIAAYSDNRILESLLRSLQGQIRIGRRYDHLHKTNLTQTFKEHQNVIMNIEKRNIKGAQQAMSRHIRKAKEKIVDFLEQNKMEDVC